MIVAGRELIVLLLFLRIMASGLFYYVRLTLML